MAFVPRNPAPAVVANDSWKAAAFLNFMIKKPDGTRTKIGAVALKQDRKQDAALIDRLQQEGGVEALMGVLEIDFRLADDGKPADLGF